MSKGSYQFQGAPTEFGKRHVRESGVKLINQIQPDYLGIGQACEGVESIGRLWWPGEPDKELVWKGGQGANEWWELARPRIRKCPLIKKWRGPNEVAIDTVAKALSYLAFEMRRITILHLDGLEAISGCTSTGCWEPWVYPHLYDIFRTTDYWEVHEYGMRYMNLGDTGHLLRYRRLIKQLKAAGIRIPPIIIGETGIDYAGNPTLDGWQKWATPEQYVGQLIAYLQEVAKDPEVILVTPFVWSDQGWPSFNHTEYVSQLYTQYIKSSQSSEAALIKYAEKWIIPMVPGFALWNYITGKNWILASQEFGYEGATYQWAFVQVTNRLILCRWQSGAVTEVFTRPN